MEVEPSVFIAVLRVGNGYVAHTGPGDKVCEDGGVWSCPGVAERCEEDEKHFARHVVKTQQSCSSQESLERDRLCIPPSRPSDGDIKPSVETETEPGHSEDVMLVFTGNCLCARSVCCSQTKQ